ncbi:MAG TPA: FecR/PupR family sigma factor regulator [Caulobacteraceae bacterium]|jgi:ferric-dicitrate binding protein FerR (iron transport regulator)|nr:FecR/PupR family sigma factor regulator [Caulobacteraceae bacterium]
MTETALDLRTERAEAAAADWLVRVQAGGLTVAQGLAFARWLGEPAHRAVFDRLEVLWLDLDEVAVLRRPSVVPLSPARPQPRRTPA